MSKRILIINQQHTSNLGDKAIGEAMCQCFDEYHIDFLPYIPTEKTESLENPIAYKKSRFKKLIDKLKLTTVFNDIIYEIKIRKWLRGTNYDLAIIGGGELLSGNLEFNSALLIWTKVLKGKNIPMIVAGVSGSVVSERLGNRYKKALNRCNEIYVRDKFTKEILENIYELKCLYCPDFVFGLNSVKEKEKKDIVTVQIYCYNYVENESKILSKEEYFEKWYRMIKQNTSVGDEIILSFSDKDDKVSTLEFKEYIWMKHGEKIKLNHTEDLERMIALLAESKKIISGRMHPMILGILCDNEIVPFISKNKIKEFKKEWQNREYEDVLNARTQIQQMIDHIKTTYLMKI